MLIIYEKVEDEEVVVVRGCQLVVRKTGRQRSEGSGGMVRGEKN